MKKTHAIGLVLWRGGFLFAGGCAAYMGARYALKMGKLFGFTPPAAVEIGICLVLSGFILVLASIVLENMQDARESKGEGT